MSYNAVIKRFTTLLRFGNGRYYRGIESVLNRLEMVLNEVFIMLYIIDSQSYVDIGELGRGFAYTLFE
jgi:hypothetical protein